MFSNNFVNFVRGSNNSLNLNRLKLWKEAIYQKLVIQERDKKHSCSQNMLTSSEHQIPPHPHYTYFYQRTWVGKPNRKNVFPLWNLQRKGNYFVGFSSVISVLSPELVCYFSVGWLPGVGVVREHNIMVRDWTSYNQISQDIISCLLHYNLDHVVLQIFRFVHTSNSLE